jgi:hypothetical protein
MAKSDLRQFDYEKVAGLDTDMWRSYYNHQFLKMFVQLLQVMRTQLRLNWFLTFRLALYSGWAAADYRLQKGREDYPRVQKNLVKFYKIISDNCTEPFDYQKAAELELEWWDIHRYPSRYKKNLEQSLADTQAAIYHTRPTKFKEYAHSRAVAMLLPNHEGDKQENPPDWDEIHKLVLKSWQSLHTAIQK